MMDRYKEEMSNVHAPVDLILKTKEAVKQEEIKYQEEKNNKDINNVNADLNIDATVNETDDSEEVLDYTNEKVVAFRKKVGKIRLISGFVAAAAVIIFIVLATGINRVDDGSDVGKLASGKQDKESSVLADDKQFQVEELDSKDVPEEFIDAEEISEGKITYRTVQMSDGGTKVFVIYDNNGYIFTFKATNIKLILPEIMNYFE